ncbi:hypothetical protein A1353_11540 [Methylomonas methanica]|uniref:ParB/Sulfiredoxin domain-containing protein n=1 Tax=Methylomonas methanica TaxID=421 RepID=A0A177MIG6_METMH|nr:hypothetical protein [Methylomonas methanica]OAI05412.1 hypothetical protein A1353_11540 [Methylomonas methanica]
MRFRTPRDDYDFDIPDEWWSFAELDQLVSTPGPYYPYKSADAVQIVLLSDIEPPQRSKAIEPFKKYKLVPLLLAFRSPECGLPPIQLVELEDAVYRYRVTNGYHRFYSSIAVGYSHAPAVLFPK